MKKRELKKIIEDQGEELNEKATKIDVLKSDLLEKGRRIDNLQSKIEELQAELNVFKMAPIRRPTNGVEYPFSRAFPGV